MCLAVPLKVIDILENNLVKVAVNNVRLTVSSILEPQLQIGDHVLVHAGFVIKKIEAQDAQEKLDLFQEILEREKELNDANK